MQQDSGRVAPHDLDTEKTLLGAMLVTGEYANLSWTIGDIRAIIDHRAFFLPDHSSLFKVIVAADDAGEVLGTPTLVPRLQSLDPRDEGVWAGYLHELKSWAEPVNGDFYARELRKKWQLRELIRATLGAHAGIYDPLADPGDIIASLNKRLDEIEQAGQGDREPVREAELLRAMENPRNAESDKVPVTIGQLGWILDGGFDRGTLSIIGARPSCGKTSLGLGLCVHACRATDGCPALFASVEMSARQIRVRLLSMRSGLPVRRIRGGDVEDDQFIPERNRAALEAENGFPLFILDGTRDVRAIAAHARRGVRRDKIGLIVVDYLGICDVTGRYDRHDLKIGAMTGLFKQLAIETNTAVIVLAQLSRGSENENRRPRLGDLRDSGLIEADADNVILIQKTGGENRGALADTRLIVAKQRQGETGDAEVYYRRPTMSYEAKFQGAEPGPVAWCGPGGA